MAATTFVDYGLASLGVFLFLVGSSLEFPDQIIKRCKAGDTICLAERMTEVLQKHYEGIPELGMDSVDPLHFTNIALSQGGNSAVTMDMSMAEGEIVGWRQMTVTNVIGFDKDPKKSKFELHVKVPLDIIQGKYEINGKLLLVPLQGKGDLKITYNDLEMDVKLITKVVTRENEDFLQIRKVHLDIYCKKAHYMLGNLFNSAEISNGLNAALNADSVLVFNSTRKSFGEARGGILQKYLSPIFDKTPYRMFFVE